MLCQSSVALQRPQEVPEDEDVRGGELAGDPAYAGARLRACSAAGKSALVLQTLYTAGDATINSQRTRVDVLLDLRQSSRTRSPSVSTARQSSTERWRPFQARLSPSQSPPLATSPPDAASPLPLSLDSRHARLPLAAKSLLARSGGCYRHRHRVRALLLAVQASGGREGVRGKRELTGERSAEPVTLPSQINDLLIVTPAAGRRVRVRALVSQPDHAQLAMEVRRCPAGSVAGGAHGFSPGTRTRGREARPNRTTVRHRAAFRRHAGQGYPLQPSPLDCLLLSRFASQSADRTQCFA